MHRMATTLALSSWLGFVVVSAALLLARSLMPEAGPSPRDAQLAVLALLAAAASMSAALLDLHGKRAERQERGEWRGVAGLLLVAVIAGAGLASGSRFLAADTAGGAFWVLLALAIAALVFDRMTFVEEADENDDELHAAIAAIARTTSDGALVGRELPRANGGEKGR